MLHRALAVALVLHAATVQAQRVPGRDLLTYPLGLAGEAAAFGSAAASGLWNPATAMLGDHERGRIAVSALSAPIDLALTGQVLHGAIARDRIGTLSMSIARASIAGLVHTETDPQSVGADIPYSTWVLSAGVARRVARHAVAGGALRWHSGHVGDQQKSSVATDVGVVVDALTGQDVRVAISSFLLSPGSNDSPSLSAAADMRVHGNDSARTVRGGVGYVRTRGSSAEVYPFVDARAGKISVRGGPVRVTAYGATTWRLRLAVVLRHAGYTIGLMREDNESGLAPTYQLGIANVFR